MQSIYLSLKRLDICKTQLVFCLSFLGINYCFWEPRQASIKWLNERWCKVLLHHENDFLEPGHAATTVVSASDSVTVWLYFCLDYLQANLTPSLRKLDSDLSPWSEQKGSFVTDNVALGTMKFFNAIFSPFSTWGSNFVLLVISKWQNSKQCGLRH